MLVLLGSLRQCVGILFRPAQRYRRAQSAAQDPAVSDTEEVLGFDASVSGVRTRSRCGDGCHHRAGRRALRPSCVLDREKLGVHWDHAHDLPASAEAHGRSGLVAQHRDALVVLVRKHLDVRICAHSWRDLRAGRLVRERTRVSSGVMATHRPARHLWRARGSSGNLQPWRLGSINRVSCRRPQAAPSVSSAKLPRV